MRDAAPVISAAHEQLEHLRAERVRDQACAQIRNEKECRRNARGVCYQWQIDGLHKLHFVHDSRAILKQKHAVRA